ncbi:hypothetical protein BCF55_0358 [Hydrogenivirga caldilitoris]|uniref:Uncharacterized protein n=1 Tax=Hydrogenivirga caldilitoris TaxID=246264 RepID=A0A497XP67_9AQUI|nr:hypothetical protein [Hydrogenivirga caldilitoris]RLJ70094.1 hypothetical protein BCF55_0358 [Hydrogenivirga caldilitoris]
MRQLMLLSALLTVLLLSFPKAGEIQYLSDRELDEVHAQGLNIINGAVGDIINSTLGNLVQNINIKDYIDMSGSVLISDNAQSNAWNPVNASNSAVNNSYNIFIIIESSLTNPTFNVNTVLNAINGSTLP